MLAPSVAPDSHFCANSAPVVTVRPWCEVLTLPQALVWPQSLRETSRARQRPRALDTVRRNRAERVLRSAPLSGGRQEWERGNTEGTRERGSERRCRTQPVTALYSFKPDDRKKGRG